MQKNLEKCKKKSVKILILNFERICASPNVFCFDVVIFTFLKTFLITRIKLWQFSPRRTHWIWICLLWEAPKTPTVRFYNHISNVLRRGFRVSGLFNTFLAKCEKFMSLVPTGVGNFGLLNFSSNSTATLVTLISSIILLG